MTHEIQEWQLDAIDAVMRRCDALSDFSSDTFMETLEKMGFTIARRTNQSVSDRAMRNCSKITPHAAHDFTDYALLLRCPGVAGKPINQNHGYGTGKTWAGIRVGEPIVDEVPMTFTGHAETDRALLSETEERTTQNLVDPFTITPSGSVWVRRNTSRDDDMEGLIHDRATVVETYYKMRIDNNGRGRQFYVRYVDEDGKPHVRTQNGFIAVWEREEKS